jgi:hypothetical protein
MKPVWLVLSAVLTALLALVWSTQPGGETDDQRSTFPENANNPMALGENSLDHRQKG